MKHGQLIGVAIVCAALALSLCTGCVELRGTKFDMPAGVCDDQGCTVTQTLYVPRVKPKQLEK